MQVELTCDSRGRVVGSIAHNGAHATVTSCNATGALGDLQQAVEDALSGGLGECFWPEGGGDYRWLFRREQGIMRVVILWSIGTVTGWEHRFWAECPIGEFSEQMHAAIGSAAASTVRD